MRVIGICPECATEMNVETNIRYETLVCRDCGEPLRLSGQATANMVVRNVLDRIEDDGPELADPD